MGKTKVIIIIIVVVGKEAKEMNKYFIRGALTWKKKFNVSILTL